MSELKIAVKKNGPCRVEGPARLFDADGKEFDLTGKEAGFSLCRCGQSSNKPFCDGTHNKVSFQAVDSAPRKA
jgi:CDGSH-type Zn-finger protein